MQQTCCYRAGGEMGVLDLRAVGDVWVCLSPTCYLVRSSSLVSRGCLMGLWSGTKKLMGGGKLEGANLWDPQEMGARTREGCHGCSTVELGLNLGVGSRGKKRKKVC